MLHHTCYPTLQQTLSSWRHTYIPPSHSTFRLHFGKSKFVVSCQPMPNAVLKSCTGSIFNKTPMFLFLYNFKQCRPSFNANFIVLIPSFPTSFVQNKSQDHKNITKSDYQRVPCTLGGIRKILI